MPDKLQARLGTGLNTRFERVDNGQARWLDVDLPLADPLLGKAMAFTLFRARSPAAAVRDSTALAPGAA